MNSGLATLLVCYLFASAFSSILLSKFNPYVCVLFVKIQLTIALLFSLFLAVISNPLQDQGTLFVADRLAVTVSTFVIGMGLVVVTFASRSLAAHKNSEKFFVAAMFLVSNTVSLAFSNQAWIFVVSWVGVSLSTVALIGFDKSKESRKAAQKAFKIFLVGDLAFLLTLVISIVVARESFSSISQLVESLNKEIGLAHLFMVLGLLFAAFSRSAQIPLNSWLPNSVAAPTPVSALLHAGVVNGSAIIYFRWYGLTSQSALYLFIAVIIGTLSVLLGMAVARTRPDVKSGLAWTTIAQMGFMTVQFALGLIGPALVHMFMHGYFKSWLFLGSSSGLDNGGNHKHPKTRKPSFIEAIFSIVVGGMIVAVTFAAIRPHFLENEAVVVPISFTWITVSYVIAQWWARSHKARIFEYLIPVAVTFAASFFAVGASSALEKWLEIEVTSTNQTLISVLAIMFVAFVSISWLAGMLLIRKNSLLANFAWFQIAKLATPNAEPAMRAISTTPQEARSFQLNKTGAGSK